jgi:hypothetical protein
MATEIAIKHKDSGLMKTGVYGFSWTYFFFGPFVPLLRGEIGIGILHWLLTVLTVGIWWLFMIFLYNKQYMNRMLTNGWVLAGSEEENRNGRLALGMAEDN